MKARTLALPAAVAGLWLVLGAAPAFADGGPHMMSTNNGSAGLSADSCAGCHRAHTATAADLLGSEQPELCLNCHDGSKATTDVVDGVQYSATDAEAPDTSPVLGALRGGGFAYALIDSTNAARLTYSFGGTVRFTAHVGVLTTGQKVTSTHGMGATGTVWGNGAASSPVKTYGVTVSLECASCHNPHGNGQYRILQTKPGEDFKAAAPAFTQSSSGGVEVKDGLYTGLRNYTVKPSTDATAANVVGTTYQGDYWRYRYDPTGATTWTRTSNPMDTLNVGWDGISPVNTADNGGTAPSNSNGTMTAWCIQCHTRYSGLPSLGTNPVTGLPSILPSSIVAMTPNDAAFLFKHGTTTIGCEQCHVAHGSNALMTGADTLDYANPDGSPAGGIGDAGPSGTVISGDSRLLKVSDRGTCQLCHDPTGTVKKDVYSGPTPTPGL